MKGDKRAKGGLLKNEVLLFGRDSLRGIFAVMSSYLCTDVLDHRWVHNVPIRAC